MDIRIDRNRGSSPRRQVRAAILRQIASGALSAGDLLPSVRDLADRAGIAPMTVTRVYAELKESGLIEARTGAGTFVSESALSRLGSTGTAARLWQAIDVLVAEAARHGIGADDLQSLVASRHRAGRAAPRMLMVGLFAEATRSYAACVEARTGLPLDAVALLDEAPPEAELGARLAAADLILTFATLRDRLARLAPGRDIVSLRFIPAERTRLSLAALDPMARLVAVSRFEDFLPILTLGVRRFASHVHDVTSCLLGARALPDLLARADVVVMSTGATGAAAAARPGATLIEFLHIPDPGDVDRLVVPRIASGLAPGPSAEPDSATPSARKEAS